MAQTMGALLRHTGARQIPFVWFWPDGAEACVIMTHDVEGQAGFEFCDDLMDLDESRAIRSAFQIIPQMNGNGSLQQRVRRRGFEVNLHDLNHDGHLFSNREEFLRRAAVINRHARECGCRGFRSAVMYRDQRWFDAFEFSFDMSVPNVAHLEPQRGGCCTVMPHFVGHILELPLTTAQDYSLFHVLGDYSIELWREQIGLILARNGLITFITHPDYLVDPRALAVYRELLEHLSRLRTEHDLWMALPGEVDGWWRNRRRMQLVRRGYSWSIEGPDAHRARVAYATLNGGRLKYSLAPQSANAA